MAYRGIELSISVIHMNWLNLQHDLAGLEALAVDFLHYDVMDGYFVPEISVGPPVINQIRNHTQIPSDYHAMVEEPRRIFDHFGLEKDAYFNIHYEACRNLHRELVTLRKLGFRPGVVLCPATTLENVEYVIEEVDKITIMNVNPGYHEQKMITQTLDKVKQVQSWRRQVDYPIKIAVDGNLEVINIPQIVAAGADVLVIGHGGLFVDGASINDQYEKIKSAIDEGLKAREDRS